MLGPAFFFSYFYFRTESRVEGPDVRNQAGALAHRNMGPHEATEQLATGEMKRDEVGQKERTIRANSLGEELASYICTVSSCFSQPCDFQRKRTSER